VARGLGRLLLRGLAGGDVEGVELAAGGGLDDGVAGGIVRDVAAKDSILRTVLLQYAG